MTQHFQQYFTRHNSLTPMSTYPTADLALHYLPLTHLQHMELWRSVLTDSINQRKHCDMTNVSSLYWKVIINTVIIIKQFQWRSKLQPFPSNEFYYKPCGTPWWSRTNNRSIAPHWKSKHFSLQAHYKIGWQIPSQSKLHLLPETLTETMANMSQSEPKQRLFHSTRQ